MTAVSEESQDRRRATTGDPEVEAELRATERVITFSDAVIAIAITLLALALPVPGGTGNLTNGQFLHAMREDWPEYFAFLISFVVIGNQWATHRRVFRYVARLTGWVGRLNMLWLLMMVLTPFAARMLAGAGALRCPLRGLHADPDHRHGVPDADEPRGATRTHTATRRAGERPSS